MWYNPKITLSHNCLFNMVLGARTCGKTFSTNLYAINKHFNKQAIGEDWQMAYVRRYKPEMKQSKFGFFSALKAKGFLDGHEAKVSGNVGYIDKVEFCHFFTLSQASGYKSVEHPHIQLIVFDEFLIDNAKYHYLPGEVEAFLELYVTIARDRDVPVLFLANSITQTNPYFAYFNVIVNGDEFQRIGKDLLIHVWKDNEQIDERKNSRFGKLISGTNYEKYSIENEFLKDNLMFVEKRSANSSPLFMYDWEGKTYTVWKEFSEGKVWITHSTSANVQAHYVFTKDDMTPNKLLARGFKNGYHFRIMQEAMRYGCLYYDTIDTKNNWYNVTHMITLL